MKNYDLEKRNLNELKKRLLSMVTAGVIMATPVAASATSTNGDEGVSTGFKLVQQERVLETLTFDKFVSLIERAYNYTREFFDYPNMLQDIENLCYLMNYSYMDQATKMELVAGGYVKEVNPNEGKFDAVISSQSFLNVCSDYNQSTIRHTTDETKLFDISVFCYDESDKDLAHEAHGLWVKSHLNNTFDYDSLNELFKMLTTLNAAEGKRNADDMQPGAKFAVQLSLGNNLRQVIRDYLSDNYSIDELSKYFVRGELLKKQWILRDDFNYDECPDLLQLLVSKFGQTGYYCLEVSLNDLMKLFDNTCAKTR